MKKQRLVKIPKSKKIKKQPSGKSRKPKNEKTTFGKNPEDQKTKKQPSGKNLLREFSVNDRDSSVSFWRYSLAERLCVLDEHVAQEH